MLARRAKKASSKTGPARQRAKVYKSGPSHHDETKKDTKTREKPNERIGRGLTRISISWTTPTEWLIGRACCNSHHVMAAFNESHWWWASGSRSQKDVYISLGIFSTTLYISSPHFTFYSLHDTLNFTITVTVRFNKYFYISYTSVTMHKNRYVEKALQYSSFIIDDIFAIEMIKKMNDKRFLCTEYWMYRPCLVWRYTGTRVGGIGWQ